MTKLGFAWSTSPILQLFGGLHWIVTVKQVITAGVWGPPNRDLVSLGNWHTIPSTRNGDSLLVVSQNHIPSGLVALVQSQQQVADVTKV